MLILKSYPKVCEMCGEKFIAYAPHAKYCPKCRHKADLLKQAERRKQNPELHRERCRKSYQKHREKRLEEHRIWQRKNYEHCLEYNRKWREENRDYFNAYCREYREKNRELINLNRRIAYYDKCAEYWNSLEEEQNLS